MSTRKIYGELGRGSDILAPRAVLFIEDDQVAEDIMDDLISVSWDSSVELTSSMEIVINNTAGKYTDNLMLGPGNEVEFWVGYGNDIEFAGRAEIVRLKPSFASGATPTISITAWDRSWRMKKTPIEVTGAGKQPKKKGKEQVVEHKGTVAGFVERIAKKYGMKPDVGTKFTTMDDRFIQKKSQTDWQTLRALANFYDAIFRVEWRPASFTARTYLKTGELKPDGDWYLIFRDIFDTSDQKQKSKLYFMEGDQSVLSEVEFELSIDIMSSEVQAQYWDPDSTGPDGKKGGWRLITEEAVEIGEEDPIHKKGASQKNNAKSDPHPTKLRLAAAGYSLTVLTRRFKDAAEARSYIAAWFAKNKDNFITAEGTLVGYQYMRAGEVHEILGEWLGKRYEGDYLMHGVRQRWSSSGFMSTFSARRTFQGSI